MTQNFKGDATELKMQLAASAPFDLCSAALDQFFAGGYDSSDFLLMLYDAGRMPFSDRVPRDSFVSFIAEAIPNFPVTGTFEAYIFILDAIFGDQTEVEFDVPSAGKLEMIVNAAASLDFDFQGREFSDSVYTTFEIVTMDDETIQFTGISGIDSEAELTQLLAELIPAGIWPDIALTFFTLSEFVAEDPVGEFYTVVDWLGNQIVFYET